MQPYAENTNRFLLAFERRFSDTSRQHFTVEHKHRVARSDQRSLHVQLVCVSALHMLPQSIHRQLVPRQQCLHTLHLRRAARVFIRTAPLVRCQAIRGARQDFRGEAQDSSERTQQGAANFWDKTNAQGKAQAATKEASKRCERQHARL